MKPFGGCNKGKYNDFLHCVGELFSVVFFPRGTAIVNCVIEGKKLGSFFNVKLYYIYIYVHACKENLKLKFTSLNIKIRSWKQFWHSHISYNERTLQKNENSKAKNNYGNDLQI